MSSRDRNRKAFATIRRYGRPYRSTLLVGTLGTVAVVAFRLAMPWPLRGLMEAVFPGTVGSRVAGLFGEGGHPIPWFVAMYVGVAIAAGLAEMVQRIFMKKFAVRTTHDLRAAAVRSVLRGPGTEGRGDLIARIVGDSARLSVGISGILVHLSQNGLIFVGVCIMFLFLAPLLGLFFLVGGLISIWIASRASGTVSKTARKQREKEGDYASTLEHALDSGTVDDAAEKINRGSARADVKATKIITFSSLLVHGVLALTIGAGLWVGASQVESGNIEPGLLFLFVVYAVTVHRRIVQVGRQVARSGKVFASADRIRSLLDESREPDAPAAKVAPAELKTALRFENVRLAPLRKGEERARFKADAIILRAGEHVAVIGGEGDGKSSLLRVLAGREPLEKGAVTWDDTALAPTGEALAPRVAFLSQDPVFSATRIWELLGLASGDALTPEQGATLQSAGVSRVIQRLPKEMDQKVGSARLSRNQARALALGAILLGERPIWVLDVPLDGLSSPRSRSRLNAILHRAKGRTLVVSLSRTSSAKRFDRVIILRRGRVRFNGTVEEWRAWKARGGATNVRDGETSCRP